MDKIRTKIPSGLSGSYKNLFNSSGWTDPDGNLSVDDTTLQEVLDKLNTIGVNRSVKFVETLEELNTIPDVYKNKEGIVFVKEMGYAPFVYKNNTWKYQSNIRTSHEFNITGVGEETEKFQNLIDSIEEGDYVAIFSDIYLSGLQEHKIVRSDFPSNVTFNFNGHTIHGDPTWDKNIDTWLVQLRGAGTQTVKTLVAHNLPFDNTGLYPIGTTSYTLDSTENIEVGDLVVFHSTRQFDNAGNKETFETQRVYHVENNTIYVDAPAKVSFSQGDTATFYKLSQNLEIHNLKLNGYSATQSGILIQYFNKPFLNNISLDDFDKNGLYIRSCSEDISQNIRVNSAGRVLHPNDGYEHTDPQNLTFGYGLIHAWNCYSSVFDSIGKYSWHSFEASDGQRDITYYNCKSISDAFGFSTHENCVSAKYVNCSSDGKVGITARCRYVDIIGGEYYGNVEGTLIGLGSLKAVLDGVAIKATPNRLIDGNITLLNTSYQESNNLVEPEDITVETIVKDCIFDSGDIHGAITLGATASSVVTFDNNIVKGHGTIIVQGSEGTISNSHIKQFDSKYALEIKTYSSKIKGNDISFSNDGTLNDAIAFIYSGTPMTALLQNNNFSGTMRFITRAVGSTTENDITLQQLFNYFNPSNASCRGAVGNCTIKSQSNIFNQYFTIDTAYSEAYGCVVDSSSTGDVFQKNNTIFMRNLPPASSDVEVGQLYTDNGHIMLKEV
jgi:hypothetical protein